MLDKQSILWYPMRVSYSSATRLMNLKELLDKDDLVKETYVPMRYKTQNFKLQLLPVVDNLIFIHTKYDDLAKIKENKAQYEPLRYIMHPVLDGESAHTEPLFVPERQMKDFIRVTAEQNDQVVFLENMDFACRPGVKVLITEGMFAGVKGVVKSIRKHLCVVLPIKDVMAVAVTNVPKKHLVYITDDEYERD